MLKTTYSIAVCSTVALLLLLLEHGLAAEPANPTAVLAPFVNDDTLAVAYIDVASLSASNTAELFSLLPKLKLPEAEQAKYFGAMMVGSLAKRFQDAGGQGIYAVAGLGDIRMDGGPLFVATVRQGRRPEDVEQLFHDVIHEIANPYAQQIDIQRKGDVVVAGMKATVARYARLKPLARNNLICPLAKFSSEGAVVAAVFCPGQDYRRVSRELWPEMPGGLAPLRGELADRWVRFEAAINLPPNPNPRIALQAKDAEAAKIFADLYRNLPAAIVGIKELGEPPQDLKQALEAIVEAIPPQQDGARVTLTISTDKKQLEKLQKLVVGTADSAMEPSRRAERANQFKQLVLAMFLYLDEHKTFPPAAIRDKDGKPLLSWRVAILPYIERSDLYEQFHLDEAWDSPHNRTLIEKMPALFADPDPKLKKLTQEGKTMYQVPVGPETVFYKNEGTSIREITDGASHTILIVEVEPQRAVVWSKPDDWQVDLKHPRQGLEWPDRPYVTAGFADGHVEIITLPKVKDSVLRAFITRAGHETVEQ